MSIRGLGFGIAKSTIRIWQPQIPELTPTSPKVDPQKEPRSTKKRAKRAPLRRGLELLSTVHLFSYGPRVEPLGHENQTTAVTKRRFSRCVHRNEPATFRGGAGHFCGRVRKLATGRGRYAAGGEEGVALFPHPAQAPLALMQPLLQRRESLVGWVLARTWHT